MRISTLLLIVIAFTVTSFVSSKHPVFIQQELKNTKKTKALCNDGSTPVFYISINQQKSNDWLLFFKGGAGCYNNESCLDRFQNHFHLVSSEPYRNVEFTNASGIFNRDCSLNPLFCNYNFVYPIYCSSDWWTGSSQFNMKDNEGREQKIYFKGHKIVVSLVKQLQQETDIGNAENIIVAGNSAGGVSAQVNSDLIKNILTKMTKLRKLKNFKMLLDSSVFLKGDGFNQLQCNKTFLCNIQQTFRQGLKIWKSKLHEKCAYQRKGENLWECLTFQTMIQYQQTHAVVLMNKYDTYQWQSDGLSLDYEIYQKKEENFFLSRGQTVRMILNEEFKINDKIDGVLLSSCFFHTFLPFDKQFLHDKINNEDTPAIFLEKWIKNGNRQFLQETCDGMGCNQEVNCQSPKQNSKQHLENEPLFIKKQEERKVSEKTDNVDQDL